MASEFHRKYNKSNFGDELCQHTFEAVAPYTQFSERVRANQTS